MLRLSYVNGYREIELTTAMQHTSITAMKAPSTTSVNLCVCCTVSHVCRLCAWFVCTEVVLQLLPLYYHHCYRVLYS
jgi:hypothetical protein